MGPFCVKRFKRSQSLKSTGSQCSTERSVSVRFPSFSVRFCEYSILAKYLQDLAETVFQTLCKKSFFCKYQYQQKYFQIQIICKNAKRPQFLMKVFFFSFGCVNFQIPTITIALQCQFQNCPLGALNAKYQKSLIIAYLLADLKKKGEEMRGNFSADPIVIES